MSYKNKEDRTAKILSYYHEFRRKSILDLGGKCVNCGSTEYLEFDHIDPNTKIASVSKMWSFSKEKVQEELKKCQLLCHECHLEKNKRDNGTAKHGTLSMYRYCRCVYCKEAKRMYTVEYCRLKSRNKYSGVA